MQKRLSIIFSLTMLCIIIGNSILEIGLAAKPMWVEHAKAAKKNSETDENSENKNTKKETDEKEQKSKEELGFVGAKNLYIQALSSFSNGKIGLTHFYADNLSYASRELESPPPENLLDSASI